MNKKKRQKSDSEETKPKQICNRKYLDQNGEGTNNSLQPTKSKSEISNNPPEQQTKQRKTVKESKHVSINKKNHSTHTSKLKNHNTHTNKLDSKSIHIDKKKSVSDIAVQKKIINKIKKAYKLKTVQVVLIKDNVENMRKKFFISRNNKKTAYQNDNSKKTFNDAVTRITKQKNKSPIKLSQDINYFDSQPIKIPVSQLVSQFYDTTDSETTDSELKNLMKEDIAACNIEHGFKTEMTNSDENLHVDATSCQSSVSDNLKTGEKTPLATILCDNQNSCIKKIQSEDSLLKIDIADSQKICIEKTENKDSLPKIDIVSQIGNNMENTNTYKTKKRKRIINRELLSDITTFDSEYYLIRGAIVFYQNEVKLRRISIAGSEISLASSTGSFSSSTISLSNKIISDNWPKENQPLYEAISPIEIPDNEKNAKNLKSKIETTSFCTKSNCISNETGNENSKEENVYSTSKSNTVTSFHMKPNYTLNEAEIGNSMERNLMSESVFSSPTKCFGMKPNCIPNETLKNVDEQIKLNAASGTALIKKSINNINNNLICEIQDTLNPVESVSPKPSINHNSVSESVSSTSNLMSGRIVSVIEINKISTYRIETRYPLCDNVSGDDTEIHEDDTEINNLKSTIFTLNNNSTRSVTGFLKEDMKITVKPIRESTNESVCQNFENTSDKVNPITPSKNIESTIFKLPKVPNLSQLNRPPDRPKNPKRIFSVDTSPKVDDNFTHKNSVRQDLNPKISWPSKPDDCLSLYYADSLCSQDTLHERSNDFDDVDETNVEIQETSGNNLNLTTAHESMNLDSLSSTEIYFDESPSTINDENCRKNNTLNGQISNTLHGTKISPDFIKYRETSQILSSPANSSPRLCSTDGVLSLEERNSVIHDDSNDEQRIVDPGAEDDCVQKSNESNVPEERRFLLSRLSDNLSENSVEQSSDLNFNFSSDNTETVSQKSSTESNRGSEKIDLKHAQFPESQQHSTPAIVNTSKRLTPVNRNTTPQAQISNRLQFSELCPDITHQKKKLPRPFPLESLPLQHPPLQYPPLQHPPLHPPPLFPNHVLPLHPEVPPVHLQFNKHRMPPNFNRFNPINTVPYAPNSLFNNPNSVTDANISRIHATGPYPNFSNTHNAPSSSHSIPSLFDIAPVINQQLQFSDKTSVDRGQSSAHVIVGNSQRTAGESSQLPLYPVVDKPSQSSNKTYFNRNNYVPKAKLKYLTSFLRRFCYSYSSSRKCFTPKCPFEHSTKDIEKFFSNESDAEELMNVYYQVFDPSECKNKIFILMIISQLGKLENEKCLFEMSKHISDSKINDKIKLEYMQNIVQSLGDALVPFNEAVSQLFNLTTHNKSIVDILLKIVLRERFIETNWELIRKLTAVDGYEMDIYDTVQILNDCCKKPKKYYLKDIFYDVLLKMAPVNVKKIDKNILERYLSHLNDYNLQIEHNKLKDMLLDINSSDPSSGFFSQNQNPSAIVPSNHHTNSVQMQNIHKNQMLVQNTPINRIDSLAMAVVNLKQAINAGNVVYAFEILKTAQPDGVISMSGALFDAIKDNKKSATIIYDQIMSNSDKTYDQFQLILSLNLLVHYYERKMWQDAFNILQKVRCKLVDFVNVKLFCNSEYTIARRLIICCEVFTWASDYRNAFNIFVDKDHPLILSQDKWNLPHNEEDITLRNNLFSSIIQRAIKNSIDTALSIVTMALAQKGYNVDIKNHFDDLLVTAMNEGMAVKAIKLIRNIPYKDLETMQPTTLRGALICAKRNSDYNEFMNLYKKLCKLSVYIKYDKDSKNIRIPEDMSPEEIFCILDDFFQRVALAKEPSHAVTISVVPASTYNLNNTLRPNILKKDNNNNAGIKIRNVLKNMMKPPVQLPNDNNQGSVIMLQPQCFEDNIRFKRSKK